jgi:hypothetical protein
VNCPQLSQGGIPTNNSNFNTISNPKIQVPIGSQIVYEPYNPPTVNAGFLIGKYVSNFDFSLTDETNAPVNTNGETYSINVNFKYYL